MNLRVCTCNHTKIMHDLDGSCLYHGCYCVQYDQETDVEKLIHRENKRKHKHLEVVLGKRH